MFEEATRKKFRFPSSKGDLTVEQVWDLPLSGITSLNAVAITINNSLKEVTEESFVIITPNPLKGELTVKLEIIKYIIMIKLKEKEQKEQYAKCAEKRSKLLDALAAKEDQELTAKSKEDILKELSTL